MPGHLDELLPYAKMISPLLAGVAAHQDSKQSGAGAPRMVEVQAALAAILQLYPAWEESVDSFLMLSKEHPYCSCSQSTTQNLPP